MAFLLRWLLAFALLAAIYNPTAVSLYAWADLGGDDDLPLLIVAALATGFGLVVYLHATLRALGVFGILLFLATLGTLAWVGFDLGFWSLDDPALNIWISLAVVALVLATGRTLAILRRDLAAPPPEGDPPP